MQPRGNDWPGGWDSSMKISANFIHVFPLKKPLFSPVWHGPHSRWPPFEHSSTKMGSLDIDPVYSTLCPSITSTCSTSKITSTCFSTVFQVSSCLTHLLTARTVHKQCEKVEGKKPKCGHHYVGNAVRPDTK